MKAIHFLIALYLIFSVTSEAKAQKNKQDQKPAETSFHRWWEESYFFRNGINPQQKLLPRIMVQGNKFVNSRGDTLLFRGLSISDPDKVEHEGHWNKQYFLQAKNIGAMIIRIPVHPVAWRERSPREYLGLLDSAVAWCTDLGMYVDIDWHTIGNLRMELFQDPMYNTTLKETYEFWRTIAQHFQGHHTVAFYEIFNEPTTYRGQLGSCSWSDWKKINEDIIHLIRAYNDEAIPLVAGFDWAYDLTPLHDYGASSSRKVVGMAWAFRARTISLAWYVGNSQSLLIEKTRNSACTPSKAWMSERPGAVRSK